ncbi:protein of unknown function [Streptomyces murinus]
MLAHASAAVGPPVHRTAGPRSGRGGGATASIRTRAAARLSCGSPSKPFSRDNRQSRPARGPVMRIERRTGGREQLKAAELALPRVRADAGLRKGEMWRLYAPSVIPAPVRTTPLTELQA